MPQITFSPHEWHHLNHALNTYMSGDAEWEEATDNGDWDHAAQIEENMQSAADVVLDIMLHVRTQQFSEGVSDATH